MSIQSINLCSKQGKLLLSRSFTPTSTLNLKESVHSLPKLIQSNSQHTFIQTSNQLMLYLPLNTIYLVIITSKQINILETQKLLNIIHKKCQELSVQENNIKSLAFEILLLFDMCVNEGIRDPVTYQDIGNQMQMNSVEENLDKLLKIAKENEAKEQAKKFIREKHKSAQDSVQVPVAHRIEKKEFTPYQPEDQIEPQSFVNSKFKKKSGLKLGQKAEKKQEKVIIQKQEEIVEQEFNPLKEPIQIVLKESINASISREGDLQSFELIGETFLKCMDQKRLNLAVSLSKPNIDIQIRPNPNFNKNEWNQNQVLVAKQGSLPYNQNIPALKYKYNNINQNQLPFQFTYWFNDSSLTIELEHQQGNIFELSDLSIIIPCPCELEVSNLENSKYEFENQYLVWKLPKLVNNETYSIEVQFSSQQDIEEIFPLQVQFESQSLLSGMYIKQVINQEDQTELNYDCKIQLTTSSFQIA